MEKETKKATGREFELTLMRDIYRRNPADPRVVELLATLYTELGMIEEGLALDRRHIELEPDSPTAHYNCACSLSLYGQFDEAFERLRESLELGFDNVPWMYKDPDLKALREDPRWDELAQMYPFSSDEDELEEFPEWGDDGAES